MYTFSPSEFYKYATKLGDKGESVAALQVNLHDINPSVGVDGDFGPVTQAAVKSIQMFSGLTIDGVAGPLTQQAICLRQAVPARDEYSIPVGLLKGICENESGYILAAYSSHPSDSGFDLGPYQDAFPPRVNSQTNYQNAYSALLMAKDTALTLRTQKGLFKVAPMVSTTQRAWELATLYHNWPFAAVNLANHGNIYPTDLAKENQFASWVFDASGGTLSTPLQWANHYVDVSCKYVTNWTT